MDNAYNDYYFQHDYNARNDQKILMLRGKFGNEGYALFFYVLETMAEERDGYIYREAIGGLSLGYGVANEMLLTFIEFCLQIKLLKEDQNGIYSTRIKEYKKIRDIFSQKGKEGAEKRWGKAKKIAPLMLRKGKERKGNLSSANFEEFWKIYPKKIGKKESEEEWSKVAIEECKEAINTLMEQCDSPGWKEDEGRWIPYPAKWLKGEHWKNKPINQNIKKKKNYII